MKEIKDGIESPRSDAAGQPAPAITSDSSAASPERQKGSGVHATEADAVSGAPSTQSTSPPMQHATVAEAVPGASEGVTSLIDITDFTKVELRVGEVLKAERIPKADKLLLLSVDIGEEKPRQILAGIAQFYEPERLVSPGLRGGKP